MKRIKGSVMLLLAAFFWGTTFAAQSSATDNIQTFTFNAARSFVGAAFLGIIILIRKKRKRTGKNHRGSRESAGGEKRRGGRSHVRLSFICCHELSAERYLGIS